MDQFSLLFSVLHAHLTNFYQSYFISRHNIKMHNAARPRCQWSLAKFIHCKDAVTVLVRWSGATHCSACVVKMLLMVVIRHWVARMIYPAGFKVTWQVIFFSVFVNSSTALAYTFVAILSVLSHFLLRGICLASLYVKMTEGDDVIDNPSHTHQYDK